MGVCCVKGYKKEPGELVGTDKKADFVALYKNNKDVLLKIVKIQSFVRRYRATKQLKQLRETKKPARRTDILAEAAAVVNENSKVQEVEAKLGPFKSDKEPEGLGQREKRPAVSMENGVTYIGEWFVAGRLTLVLGTWRPTTGRDMGCRYGATAASTRAFGRTTRLTARGG